MSIEQVSSTQILPGVAAPVERRIFYSLQAGRGIGAIMVIFFHIGNFIGNDPDLWHQTWIYHLFYFGLYGVDLFFILSGIFMLSAHWNDMGRPERLPRYLWKRFRRIYPIFWIFLIPTVIKQLRITGTHGFAQRNPFTILSSFLLVHIHSLGLNLVVSWTLFHEVMFYAIFATLLVRKRLGIVLCTLWFMASFLFFQPASFAAEPDTYAQMLFSPLHLLFALGMLIGFIMKQGRGPTNRAYIALGLALFAGCIALQGSLPTFAPFLRLFGDLGLALALITVAQRESSFNVHVPHALRLLGDASYSIYLSHFMVVWAVARIGFRLDPHLKLSAEVWVAGMLTAAIIVGLVVHLAIERPLLRLLGDRQPPSGLVARTHENAQPGPQSSAA